MGRELRDEVRALAWGSRLLERACTELSLSQYRVLALIASSPERAARLAERASVTRPTLTAVLDGLEARGLIRRGDVEGDRRGVLLEVTPEGRAGLERTEAALGERLSQVLARASDPGAVVAGLRALLAALEADWRERIGAPG